MAVAKHEQHKATLVVFRHIRSFPYTAPAKLLQFLAKITRLYQRSFHIAWTALFTGLNAKNLIYIVQVNIPTVNTRQAAHM
jgi:hypothetical protein